MKNLRLNDGRSVEVQSAVAGTGVLHIRLILQTSEQLKIIFGDSFATKKMTLSENGKEIETYENFDKLSYIKEETGGVWEVEVVQSAVDMETKVAEIETMVKENALNLEAALAELTIAIAAIANTQNVSAEVEENV